MANNRQPLRECKTKDELEEQILGKFVGIQTEDETIYFRADEVVYEQDLNVVIVNTKLAIIEYKDYTSIQYTPEPSQVEHLDPYRLDTSEFFMSSEEEFREKLNKVITNGLS